MGESGHRAPTPSRVFVPAALLTRGDEAVATGALQRAVEASPAASVDAVVVVGRVEPALLIRAAEGLRVGLALVVSPQAPLDDALLVALSQAGAERARLEVWTPAVTAEMATALGLPARIAELSMGAVAAAAARDLPVTLRLQLAAPTTGSLGEALDALRVCAEGVGADAEVVLDAVPPRADVVAAGAVVRIDEVEAALAAWLTHAPAPDRARLRLSELWPDGLVGDDPARARHPLPPAERRAWFGAAGRRPAGLPAPLADALQAAGHPPWRPGVAGGRLDLDPTCVEARGLALGLRRVWRLRLEDGALERFRRVFEAEGLVVRASEARFAEQTGGSLRLASTASGSGDLRLVAVAQREADALACIELETANATRADPNTPEQARAALRDNAAAHRALGAAYGYPPCCVEAFIDAHEEAIRDAGSRARDNAVALRRALLRSADVVPALHSVGTALAIAPASTLRHLPCRFDCAASVALAEELQRDLAQVQPALAAALRQTPPAIIALADGGVLLVHEHGGVELPAGVPPRAARRLRTPDAVQAVPAELAGEAAAEAIAAFAERATGCALVEVLPDDGVVARDEAGEVVARLSSVGSGFPVLIPFGPRVDGAADAVLSNEASSGDGHRGTR